MARIGAIWLPLTAATRQSFVVGLKRPDAFGFEEVSDVAQDVEESRDGGAGIAGEKMDAALGFEGAFDEQFIAGENFVTGLGQETGIDRHIQSVLPRARINRDRRGLFRKVRDRGRR